MSLSVSNRNAALVRTQSDFVQPQAQGPAAQESAAPVDTSAQYRASLEQSSFESAAIQTTAAPANSIAVGEPAPAEAQAPAENNRHAQLDALKKETSLEDKKAFLEQFGMKAKHLKKAKPAEINAAFDKAIDAMKEPGKTEFTTKIGGKKYKAKINLDANTGELSVNFKQKKSFLSKVGDALKKVGKIALTVASFIPGPVGIAARVANAVISSVGAFKKGDILGGIAGMAGAVAGGAGALAGKATSGLASTVSKVAGMVQKGATAAGSALTAIKERNWGNLLGAVAGGASNMANGLGNSAGSLAKGLNQVSEWATRGQTALHVAAAARNGDILGALEAGSNLATDVAPNSRAARVLGDINEFVSPLRDARRLIGG